MSDERVRLFVALELGEEPVARIVEWREQAVADLDGLRSVGPASLHATLCFLGSRPASEVEAIASACSVLAACPPAMLSFADAIWLPRRRPSLLAVRLEDEADALAAAQLRLSRELTAGGFYEPEKRPFLAHVTLARVRRGARVRAVSLPEPPRLRFPGEAVILFRSRLGPGGASYEPLRTVVLGG